MPDPFVLIEVNKINSVLANFDWKLIKQEITEQDIVLTIHKVIPVPRENPAINN